MLSGVFNNSKSGLAAIVAITIIIKDAIAVNTIHVPIVPDNASLFFAPRYCDTIILAPTEIPTNNTIKRFRIGPALPTAASALSPTYLPTTILSTVL